MIHFAQCLDVQLIRHNGPDRKTYGIRRTPVWQGKFIRRLDLNTAGLTLGHKARSAPASRKIEPDKRRILAPTDIPTAQNIDGCPHTGRDGYINLIADARGLPVLDQHRADVRYGLRHTVVRTLGRLPQRRSLPQRRNRIAEPQGTADRLGQG